MGHQFGDLLTQYRARKHGLTQARLARKAGYDPPLVTKMCQGKKELTGPSGRERVVRIIGALRDEGVLTTLDEANALLRAAGMPPLYDGAAAEAALIRRLKGMVGDEPFLQRGGSAFAPRRSNLPTPLTKLIGRERQIDELIERVQAERLLTLTGAGGVGKTRLAIEVGTQCAMFDASVFMRGVWLVELAPVADPELVPQAVLNIFSLSEEPGRSILDVLATYLTGKRLLLILDNCEHLIGACADLAERLLSICPFLHILTTSREPLRIPGEVAWRVPSLATPDPSKLPSLQQVRDYEAIKLFINRASASQPDFTLTSGNVSAVAQICQRLDGIPLAIELAASRLQGLSVDEIAGRLDDRFRLLTSGSRTALPRHQTLRTLIDWSYDLLSEPEQVLLERLSVFTGGWTLEAAEWVRTDKDKDGRVSSLLPLLLDLVSKSLVVADEGGDETRYRLLETIRMYALEKLAQRGELDAMRRRHAEACLALVEQAESHFHAKERQHWFDRIERELDNIRTALAWGQSEAGDATMGLSLAGALWPFWWWRGSASEGGRWIEELLAAMKPDTPLAVLARALLGAGVLLKFWDLEPNLEKNSQIAAWLEEALRLFRSLGDQQGIAYALCFLSHVAWNQSDSDRALAYLEDSLVAARQLQNQVIIAYVLCELAWVVTAQQDFARAKALLDESLALARKVGDEQEMAASLLYLSGVAFSEFDFNSAAEYAQQALQVVRQAGIRNIEHDALHHLGEAARFVGDLERSRTFFEELHALSLARDDNYAVEFALHSLGKVAYDAHEYEKAHDLLTRSLTVARTPSDVMTPFNLEWLASVTGAQGQPARAARLFGAAEAIREIQRRPLPVNCVEEYERHVAIARAQLDEAAFATAWAEGKAMTLEHAVAYAREAG